MHIYKTDRRILKAAKEAQADPDGWFVIDPETMLIYRSSGYYMKDVRLAKEGTAVSRLKIDPRFFWDAMDNLKSSGLIATPGGEAFQVTYHGWNYHVVRREEIVSRLLTHVAFPSLVAFITTLVTLLLGRFFG